MNSLKGQAKPLFMINDESRPGRGPHGFRDLFSGFTGIPFKARGHYAIAGQFKNHWTAYAVHLFMLCADVNLYAWKNFLFACPNWPPCSRIGDLV
jgi:hypothetical protein